MLPGERPSTVWQPKNDTRKPPWYRFNPRVALSYVPPLVAMTLVGLLAALYFATRTPVVLVVDGDVMPLRTHARTAQSALAARGIRLAQGDIVTPGPEARLEDGMIVSVQRARDVQVSADGATTVVHTRATDPATIVAEAGVALDQSDAVLVERVAGPTPGEIADHPALVRQPTLPVRLRVVRATPITIDDDGQRFSIRTTAPTVGEALLALSEPLYEGDHVTPPYSTPISPNLEVTIHRATAVTLHIDGMQIESRTQATSVGGLLDELDMALSGDDYAIPAPDTPLKPDMAIQVVRAGEEILVKEESLPFETVWQPAPDLELDQTVVLREGTTGVLRREVRVRYEDGAEVSRVVRGEWVAQEPVDQVMGYGTQIVVRTLDTELGPLDYWRHLRVLATSYTAATSGKEPGSPGYGVTGTGLPMRRGIVAIDPEVINFFTQLYVPDYGLGLAADAGGAIKGMRIDLGYDEGDLELWYRWVDIYLLTPVPPPDEIIWVLPGAQPQAAP